MYSVIAAGDLGRCWRPWLLLACAHDVAEDVVVDDGEQVKLGRGIERRGGDRGQGLLTMAQAVGAERAVLRRGAASLQRLHGPRVAQQCFSCAAGDHGKCLAPVGGELAAGDE
jgi:hypothetical protein